ncbi:MAG: VapD family protein [Oscillospiraceae bacterium]
MDQNKKKSGSRKQITFDLSQKALAAHYPKPKISLNPTFYKRAYSDISQFMKQNGFEHRQFSVYTSIEKITNTDINLLMDSLAEKMPWLALCVNQIDVTNIGSQHSLLHTLETATALQVEQTEKIELTLQ